MCIVRYYHARGLLMFKTFVVVNIRTYSSRALSPFEDRRLFILADDGASARDYLIFTAISGSRQLNNSRPEILR